MSDFNPYDNDRNNENKNADGNTNTNVSGNAENKPNGTVWDGGCYHGYHQSEKPTGTQSNYSWNRADDSVNHTESGTEASPKTENSYGGAQQNSSPYGSAYQPQQRTYYRPYGVYNASGDGGQEPKKEKGPKKHIFRKVLVGVLACLVVSAGSIGAFAALINNGTIHIQSGATGNAFTIVKNNTSSTASTTNTTTTTSELTKQQVAKKVLPSVVCIENYAAASSTRMGTTRGQYGYGDNGQDNQNGSSETNGNEVSPSSEGSGIIMTTDGYIITNAHVVSSASSLKVVLYDGKTYSAKLIGSDSITDLALIKIEATGLTAAEFGSSSDMQVADTVMAVGNPGGMEFNSSVTVGYVSALNREITNSETGYTMKCIQTDAAINPGNSGGALVNMRGQVVGINSSKIVATGYEGLGFSIPIDGAQPIISQLKQYGYVKDRAMLGISGTYIDSMTSRFYGLSTGMYIASISSQYVSAAGIQKGDVITKIDNKAVTNQNTVSSVVASKKPGETVTLTISRVSTNKTFTATVKLSQATGKS